MHVFVVPGSRTNEDGMHNIYMSELVQQVVLLMYYQS